MFVKFNPNPQAKNVGDCVIRAVSKALDQSWEKSYRDLSDLGIKIGDLPNAKSVCGTYLKHHGFRKKIIPDTCPDCYTVREFCLDHPRGTFVLFAGEHTVTVQDGVIFDTWNSSDEVPQYYWEKM